MTEQELWETTKKNVKKINEWHKKFTKRLDEIEARLKALEQPQTVTKTMAQPEEEII